MTKEELKTISNEESYYLGYKHREMGYSIHYNPYRNLENTIKISELYINYNQGWEEADKVLAQ